MDLFSLLASISKATRLSAVILCLWFFASKGIAQDAAFARWTHLDASQQATVLALARRAFDAYVTRRTVIDPPRSLDSFLSQPAALFVSTMRHGAPRCCMGTLYPTQPNAALEIIENAVAAAGRDRRFAPIQPRELAGLTLIVSFIDRPTPISEQELAALDPLQDGLVVRCGDKSGVVLSGETTRLDRMIAWGRIRAGARPGQSVEFFRIRDVRYAEPQNSHPSSEASHG
jgi:hypothetical protein